MRTVTFSRPKNDFFSSLRSSVNNYFAQNKIKPTGDYRLYTKTIVLTVSAVALYVSLIMFSMPWYLGLTLAALFGLVQAFIGFNVMHDACHGSYSSNKRMNSFLSLSMNALGSDAFMWKQKHNLVHHTFTNIDGVDDDIEKVPLMRMCETQPLKKAHRFQHIYVVFLYAVSTIFWMYLKDFEEYFSKEKYKVKTETRDLKKHFIFWGSKIVYFGLMVALPIVILGWLPWLVGTLVMHATLGLTLSFVFQLAHVVEPVGFSHSEETKITIEDEWAVHQLKTTCDFAVNNKFVSWFLGGLNYQVEHHLFPNISHVHYPEIQKIVVATCKEYGVDYHSFPTTRQALASHFRHMYKLGRAA